MLIHQNNLLNRIDCYLESNFGTDPNCFNSTYSTENELIGDFGHVWNKGGIYLITNISQSKILYVGETDNFQSRLRPDFNTNHLRHEVYKHNGLDFKLIQVFLNPNLSASYERIIIEIFGSIYNDHYNYLARKKEILNTCIKCPGICISYLTSHHNVEYGKKIIQDLIDEREIYLYKSVARNTHPVTYVYPKMSSKQLLNFLSKNTQRFNKSKQGEWFNQALSLALESEEYPNKIATDAAFLSFLLNSR